MYKTINKKLITTTILTHFVNYNRYRGCRRYILTITLYRNGVRMISLKRFINNSKTYPLILVYFGAIIEVNVDIRVVDVRVFYSVRLGICGYQIEVIYCALVDGRQTEDLGNQSYGSVFDFKLYFFLHFLCFG